MRRLLARAFPLAVLVAIAACIGFGRYHVSSVALSQSAPTQFSCVSLLDGGSTNALCGTFNTNYSPFTVTCEASVLAGDHSSVGATVNLLASGNGTNYGPVADAGQSVVIVANGDGGAVVSTTGLAISPYNPWQSYEIMLSGIAQDAGTASTGEVNCQVSVLNVQTIH